MINDKYNNSDAFEKDLTRLLYNPAELLEFLQGLRGKLEIINPLSLCAQKWQGIKDILLKQNTFIRGDDFIYTSRVGKETVYPGSKGLVIVDDKGEKTFANKGEIVFSDLHGNYKDFRKLLLILLTHLNIGGVALTLGDNILEMYRKDAEEMQPIYKKYPVESLKVGMALFLLIDKYPKQFYFLLGNHDVDDAKKGLGTLKHLCAIYDDVKKFKCDDNLKDQIIENFYEIIRLLPECAESIPTATFYVHASLPRNYEALPRTKFTRILDRSYNREHKDTFESQATLYPGGFDREAFIKVYQKMFGFRMCVRGHDHVSGENKAKVRLQGENSLPTITEVEGVHTISSSSVPFLVNGGEDNFPKFFLNWNFAFCKKNLYKFVKIDEKIKLNYFIELVKLNLAAYFAYHNSHLTTFWQSDYGIREVNAVIRFINKINVNEVDKQVMSEKVESKKTDVDITKNFADNVANKLNALLKRGWASDDVSKSSTLKSIFSYLYRIGMSLPNLDQFENIDLEETNIEQMESTI